MSDIPFLNLSVQWEHGIVQNVLECWSIHCSFHWNYGPSFWKTTPNHNPPPPNFVLGTVQICPSDCQMEKPDSSLRRMRLHCPRVQWSRALHHCIQRFALHSLLFGLDAAARPWKPIPWTSLRTVLELIWHPLTSLRQFTKPTTLWLSCCPSQMLLFSYNEADS